MTTPEVPCMVLMELLAVLSSAFAPLNVPKSSAFILALLYAIRKPLDTSEIERITGYSKSAVSAALKVLESHKLVNRFRSGRRNLYLPSTPLPRLLAESHIRMLKSINERLREISRRSPEVGEHLSHINSELIVAIKALEAGLHGIDNGGILKE